MSSGPLYQLMLLMGSGKESASETSVLVVTAKKISGGFVVLCYRQVLCLWTSDSW